MAVDDGHVGKKIRSEDILHKSSEPSLELSNPIGLEWSENSCAYDA